MAKKTPVAGPAPYPHMAPAAPKSWAAAAASAISSARTAMLKPAVMPSGVHYPPPMVNDLRDHLQDWIDGQFHQAGSRHRFRPVLGMIGHQENDGASMATRYRFDLRVDLMTYEGQELKAPKGDDRCVQYMVAHDHPFPFEAIVGQFKGELVKQLPRWRERYDNRKLCTDDEASPMILWPPSAPMAPVKVPPFPALYGPATYASDYGKAMAEAKMKIDTSQLYGYAPRKASLVWDPAVDGKP